MVCCSHLEEKVWPQIFPLKPQGAHSLEPTALLLLLRKAVAFNCSGAGPLAEFELATGVKLTEASGRGV